jgi:3-hydroxyanthranilate 3,4-dioxygenase
MSDGSTDPIDLARWIADHRTAIDGGTAGPVLDDELRVLVVTGRGPRLDYHVNTVAELFYQLEGDIGVLLREGDTVREITVRTGEMWLAPAGVPHGPQRPVGTVGLVVERARPARSTESFRWYCGACGVIVHDIVIERVDPPELRRAIGAFYADANARTCPSCGTVISPPS